MTADLAWWAQLAAFLVAQTALLVAIATAVNYKLRAPQARRAVWQAAMIAAACVWMGEIAGFGEKVRSLVPREETRIVMQGQPFVMVESAGNAGMPVASRPVPIRRESPASPVKWPGNVWMIGTFLLLCRAMFNRCWLAWQRRQMSLADAGTRQAVARLGTALRLGNVEARYWARLRGPVAFGWWRPTVALPCDFSVRFTGGQQEAMLAHELAHLAARDPLWLALGDVVCAVAWWNPCVWWGVAQLRAASEAAADEASALVPSGPMALAESLLRFGRELGESSAARGSGVAGNGFRSSLGRRVRALLTDRVNWRELPPAWRWLSKIFAALVVIVVTSFPLYSAPSNIAGLRLLYHRNKEERPVPVVHERRQNESAPANPTNGQAAANPVVVLKEDGSIAISGNPIAKSDTLAITNSEGITTNEISSIIADQGSMSLVPTALTMPNGLVFFTWYSTNGGVVAVTNKFYKAGDANSASVAKPTSVVPADSFHNPDIIFNNTNTVFYTLTKVDSSAVKTIVTTNSLSPTLRDPWGNPYTIYIDTNGVKTIVTTNSLSAKNIIDILTQHPEFTNDRVNIKSGSGTITLGPLASAKPESGYTFQAQPVGPSSNGAVEAVVSDHGKVVVGGVFQRLPGSQTAVPAHREEKSFTNAILTFQVVGSNNVVRSYVLTNIAPGMAQAMVTNANGQIEGWTLITSPDGFKGSLGGQPESQTAVPAYRDESTSTKIIRNIEEVHSNNVVALRDSVRGQPGGQNVMLEVKMATVEEGSAAQIEADKRFQKLPPDQVAGADTVAQYLRDAKIFHTDYIRTDFKYAENETSILQPSQFKAMIQQFEQERGTDVLSMPKAASLPGRAALLGVENYMTAVTGMEQVYAPPPNGPGYSFVTDELHLGVTARVTPTLSADGWNLSVTARQVDFIGYDEPTKAQNAAHPHYVTPLPHMRVAEIRGNSALQMGDTLMLRGPVETVTNKVKTVTLGFIHGTRTETHAKRLYVFVTLLPDTK